MADIPKPVREEYQTLPECTTKGPFRLTEMPYSRLTSGVRELFRRPEMKEALAEFEAKYPGAFVPSYG